MRERQIESKLIFGARNSFPLEQMECLTAWYYCRKHGSDL